MGHLTIRRYVDGDEEKIFELLSIVYAGWKGKDYWYWKYKRNPAGFYSNIWVVENGDKIVAYWAIIPTKIKVGNTVILGAQSVDAATHPDYRKSGLSTTLAQKTLAEAVKDGILIVYGFPGRMSYGGFIKRGGKDLGFVPKRYKILKISKALNLTVYWNWLIRANPKAVRAVVSMFWRALRKQNITSKETSHIGLVRDTLLLIAVLIFNPRVLFTTPGAKETPGLEITKENSFDEQISRFWLEISPNFPNAVDRNRDYLNWRYCENPLDKYVIYIARKNDIIEGYIILKSEGKEGVIMDILARDEQIFSSLLRKALQVFHSEGKATVQVWMPNNNSYSRILKRYGFGSYQWLAGFFSKPGMLKGIVTPFTLYLNSPQSLKIQDELCIIERWFLSVGDSDVF